MRPFFDQTEGYALAVLDTLCTGQRLGPRPVEKKIEPSDELLRIAAERLSIHCHRWLLPGGRAERTVLRDGRRETGRLWDEALNGPFHLRFTAASPALWLAITRHQLGRKAVGTLEKTRQVIVEGTECGDWIFYALAADHARVIGDFEAGSNFFRRMRSGSPLVVLTTLHPQVAHAGGVQNHLDRLLRPAVIRIVECIDDLLVDHWVDTARVAAASPADLEDFVERFRNMGMVLAAWLEALDGRGRLDLARTLMRFAVAFATEVVKDPEAIRHLVTHRLRPRTMRERTAALETAADVARIGLTLRDHRSRFAALRYGEERWEEGQLFMADYDAIVLPHAERIRQVEYVLRGTIG